MRIVGNKIKLRSHARIRTLRIVVDRNGFAAALAPWVRTFAPQAEGWVFESKPRQT